jgi:hypothetical protein
MMPRISTARVRIIATIIALLIASWVAATGQPRLVDACHGLNDIESIYLRDSTEVRFLSASGALVFDRDREVWSIDLVEHHRGPTLPRHRYHEKRASSHDCPRGAVRAAYRSVMERISRGGTEMLLLRTAGEGAVWGTHCIVDTLARRSYWYPHNRTKAIEFDDHSIWLGHYAGIMQLDRRTGARRDFVALPIIEDDSQVIEYEGNIVVATNGAGIQLIDAGSGTMTFWSVSELLGPLHRRWRQHNPRYAAPTGKAIFTNFVAAQHLYIACRFVDGHDFLIDDSSYLLRYTAHDSSWRTEWLRTTEDPIDGIASIAVFNSYLLLGNNHRDVWEGGGYENHGGAHVYGPIPVRESAAFWRAHAMTMRDVDKRHVVADMRPDDDGAEILTYHLTADTDRKRLYRIDERFRVVVLYDSLGTYYEEYGQRVRSHDAACAVLAEHGELRVHPIVMEFDSTSPRTVVRDY